MLHRACRRRGATVRKLIDCLIAAHAIRTRLPPLRTHGDVDVPARQTELAFDAGYQASP